MHKKQQSILNTYLRRLTNLAGNNRSIYLPRISSEQFIDLHYLSQLNGEKSFSIIEALIAKESKMICPLVDSRMEISNEASKKIKRLQRIDQLIFEERGSRDLHLAWPFARGKFMDGTLVRAPLLYIPVELYVDNNHWKIRTREDGDIMFNKSFLLAYSFYNRVNVEEFLLEENFEDTERDSTVFRTALYQLLQKSSIDIHFNPDNYRDELIPFQHFTKEEFSESHGNGELKLFPEAVLGIFPQAGSYLVPDYLDIINNGRIGSLEEFFLSKNQTEQQSLLFSDFIPMIKEERLFPGFALDAWQENALKAVKSGYSIVVQGPPGTGKSQLICGLISDAIAAGKKVLLVCQKRAALDVVFKRIHEAHLSDFLALVHDFKADRKDIYLKAAKQIDRIDEYKTKNNSLDTIQLERKFLQLCHRVSQITEELEEFKKALFNNHDAGSTVKELYLLSDPTEPSINLKQEYQNFQIDNVQEFVARLRTYSRYANQFENTQHPWQERKSFAEMGIQDQKEIEKILKAIPGHIKSISDQLNELVGTSIDWQQYEQYLEQEKEAKEMLQLLKNESTYKDFNLLIDESDEETSTLWLANIQRMIIDCFQDEGPEKAIPPHQLGQLQQALYRTMKSRRSLIGLVRWELFSKDKFLIKRALVGNGLMSNKNGLKSLEKRLDNRLNIEHNFSKLRTKSWIKEFPEKYDLTSIEDWFESLQNAIKAKLLLNSIRGIRNFIEPTQLSHTQLEEKVNSFYRILSSLQPEKLKWNSYLTANQISLLADNPDHCDTLIESLRKDFDALCEFDKIKSSFNPDEKNIINRLHEEVGAWQTDVILQLFNNSLCLAWIDHLETKFPILRIVSSGKLGMMETELRELLVEKQKIGNDILLLRARELIIENLEFNRLNNRVTYRDLHHQLTKKKRIWPIRKLVNEYNDELFRLLPCWLASPESVSAIFPLQTQFDLVIFDEASQCFAERGLPAVYRGKQVVIAGDNQQLRPSDLYRVRWEDESEDDPDLEVESLLELASRYFMELPLRGHYRSQSIELIDFSNEHFYDGQLQLLPNAENYLDKSTVLEYHKVEGIWENNINEVEAEAVVQIVLDCIKKDPTKEIGVVTFNIQQQLFILDRLDIAFSEQKISKPETLIVKNIENIQGDEKDIIIFSIGYAPDKKGKVKVQFGSLNVSGGENRLNVAITRAREIVKVVCSILPHQLEVEETRNHGPKLLKKYLEFVKSVSEGNFKPFVKSLPHQKSNWYLKSRIQAWGTEKFNEFKFEDQIPFSDLAVNEEASKARLILTDDEPYRQNPSVKDLHASQFLLFEQKKWKHFRTYSRNYWHDKEKFFNEVAKFISQ